MVVRKGTQSTEFFALILMAAVVVRIFVALTDLSIKRRALKKLED